MKVVRPGAGEDPRLILDAGIAAVGAALAAVAVRHPGPVIGTIHGPAWLRVLLPLLYGAPLLLRRVAPLVMWPAIWAAVALQDLVSRHPPQGLYLLFALFSGAYALGAHLDAGRALAGLACTVPAIALIDLGGVSLGLAISPLAAFWLVGAFLRARRRQTALVARNSRLEREAEQAKAAERARIARELHDIVAHHLSVIVLQAAGARAGSPGGAAGPALEKIEASGRQALNETRRLLGVLREADADPELAPQPGVADLDALAARVRAAGLPVELTVAAGRVELPAAVDVSVYRIVQEALTNVLKHAEATRAEVTIGYTGESIAIEVLDDGAGTLGAGDVGGGHGLTGMRERTAVFGGELSAGPRPGGGFAVRARLPLEDGGVTA